MGLMVLMVTGCVAPGTDFEAQPFFRRDRLHVEYDANGNPLPARDTKSPVLLFRHRTSDGGQKVRLTLPFPLGNYARDGIDSRFLLQLAAPFAIAGTPPLRGVAGAGPDNRLFPFTLYDVDEEKEPGDKTLDEDYGFFPFIIHGYSEDEGSYTTVFPFGGTTKGLLGKDDALWIGFPFPLYLWSIDNEYESRHVLFPFINWIEGEGHSGWRLWPFYGHYKREDDKGRMAYDRTWLMWPFVTWQTNGANLVKTGKDGKEEPVPPTEVLAILPFYGSVHGPEIDEWDVLYPFFRYTSYPRDEGWELRAPFPFVIMGGNNKGSGRYDFWPFFGVKYRPGYMRHFLLAPIERWEHRDDEWVEDELFSIFPFWQSHYHLDKKTNRSYSRSQLWPFYHHRREANGDLDIHALAIMFNRFPEVEEMLYPFLRLYHYRRVAQAGSRETNLLFGLLGWRTVRKEGQDEYDRTSALFGLFQYRRKGPEKALRFFWLPEFPTWRTDS